MSWKNILKIGSCYETAYSYILDKATAGNEDLILVHADVIGTGGKVMGMCYGHAFVLDGDNVIDTETNITMPYEEYKQLGQITNEKRYAFMEMLQEAVKSGHYGPW